LLLLLQLLMLQLQLQLLLLLSWGSAPASRAFKYKISKLAFVTMANWPENNGTDLANDHGQGILGIGIAVAIVARVLARKSGIGRGSWHWGDRGHLGRADDNEDYEDYAPNTPTVHPVIKTENVASKNV